MTIFAYTELAYDKYPGFVNLTERVSNPGDAVLTVRSPDESHCSTVVLDRAQLVEMQAAITRYLNKT